MRELKKNKLVLGRNQRLLSIKEAAEFLFKEDNFKQIGITRLAVTNGLDRVGIPTASATVPVSADTISIYSGKGTSKLASQVSAVMEAVERISATYLPQNPLLYSEQELIQLGKSFCSPFSFTEKMYDGYNAKKVIEWLVGRDLSNNKDILVPLSSVITPYNPTSKNVHRVFRYTHTNGLASGFLLQEAIPQAICEVIERDAISLAELRASIFPFAKVKQMEANIQELLGESFKINNASFSDDFNLFKTVDLDTIPESGQQLLKRFTEANLDVSLKYIHSDIEIATFGCACYEKLPNGRSMFRAGYGTHPDSTTALFRAITELAQSRIVDIQGAREDVYNFDKRRTRDSLGKHWLLNASIEKIDFKEIPSYNFSDFSDEINFLVNSINNTGLKKVIVVPIKSILKDTYVVRVLIPGSESWHPTGGNSILGDRAEKFALQQGLTVDPKVSYL